MRSVVASGIATLTGQNEAIVTEFNTVSISNYTNYSNPSSGPYFILSTQYAAIVLENVQMNGNQTFPWIECEGFSSVTILTGTSITQSSQMSSECTLRCDSSTQDICGSPYNELPSMWVYIIVSILVVFVMLIGLFYVLRLSRKQAQFEHV